MSWAVASTWLTGGRRRTNSFPAPSLTLKVGFERPPAMGSKVTGAGAPGMLSTNHALTFSTSIPSICGMEAKLDAMDATDSTFETAVIERSTQVPVVVDLWAEWCGPCKTLGPIIEQVVAETGGKVELAKVDVDANPGVAQAFRVQSIPAGFAIRDKQVVDQFIGAVPEAQVREFVARLAPSKSEADLLVERGDEASLRRALELDADHEG